MKFCKRIGLAVSTIVLLCFASQSEAAFGFKLDGTLDKPAISHSYFEGEFDRILPPLEAYRQSFPSTASREDSIFVLKYLSVIYASDPTTRAKAESFMIQLIKLMPTIELIDLYISDNIESIFKNVKTNYLKDQKYVNGHDQYGKPIEPPRSKRSTRWVWLTLGGVGTAAVATTAYYALKDSDKQKEDRIGITPR